MKAVITPDGSMDIEGDAKELCEFVKSMNSCQPSSKAKAGLVGNWKGAPKATDPAVNANTTHTTVNTDYRSRGLKAAATRKRNAKKVGKKAKVGRPVGRPKKAKVGRPPKAKPTPVKRKKTRTGNGRWSDADLKKVKKLGNSPKSSAVKALAKKLGRSPGALVTQQWLMKKKR